MMNEQRAAEMLKKSEYLPDAARYEKGMRYRRAGKSGLMLPQVSLGLWQNFGSADPFETAREMVCTAFDNGVTHFDLANNYGPIAGSAESTFGRILRENFRGYRDEMIVSTKAGYDMWRGPYGDGGSKKYLTASLDQSLARMGLDYVDVFYHHRPDPGTPLEETCYTLHRFVEQGKALYIGISNYSAEQAQAAIEIFRELKTPFVLDQVCYNLLDRHVEKDGLKEYAARSGFGLIVFSPLAQGLLTDKYKDGIPADSRIRKSGTLKEERLMRERDKLALLRKAAERRGQTLSQLALSWVLKDDVVSSVIIGASSPKQILENIQVDPKFSREELEQIEEICK